jgi:hypothetical protein
VDAVIAYSTFALAVVTLALAGFTLGLMIFTYKLWNATRKLVEGTEATARQQAFDMRKSLAIARKSANAAAKAAEVAEKSLYVLQRPYVIRSSTICDLEAFRRGDIDGKIGCIFVNRGATPAVVVEVFTHMTIAATGLPEPINATMTVGESHPPSRLISRDVPEKFDFELKRLISQSTVGDALWNGKGSLFLLGFIRYKDMFGHDYLHGFCGRYDYEAKDFVIAGGADYNYAREGDEPGVKSRA